jgi:hypothetical protein
VHHPVTDADQPVAGELAPEEASEILDRALVTESPTRPGLLGDDAARRIVRHEARGRVEALDRSPYLERERAGTLAEHGELEARRAGVEHEDRVAPVHRHICSSALPRVSRAAPHTKGRESTAART